MYQQEKEQERMILKKMYKNDPHPNMPIFPSHYEFEYIRVISALSKLRKRESKKQGLKKPVNTASENQEKPEIDIELRKTGFWGLGAI
jgi:hypothetical protein